MPRVRDPPTMRGVWSSSQASDLRNDLSSAFLLASAGANVVMQLSHPQVARGVLESSVTSGSLQHRPFKRTRTTLAYVALALWGTPSERQHLREAVDAQHATVISRGPVPYSAFDPALQQWVAACMYVGMAQGLELFYGPSDEVRSDQLYGLAANLATTLQVPVDQWPSQRHDFETYWAQMRPSLSVDDATRQYLDDLIHLAPWPRPLVRLFAAYHARLSRGFIDPYIREVLGWSWSEDDQRWFEVQCSRLRWCNAHTPRPLRNAFSHAILFDARRRIRRGHSVME